MPEYRKRMVSEIWHVSPNCERWPKENHMVVNELPPGARICEECGANSGLHALRWSSMESRELNFEELTLLITQFTREYAAANDEHRRAQIATEISKLTARISVIKSRPLRE